MEKILGGKRSNCTAKGGTAIQLYSETAHLRSLLSMIGKQGDRMGKKVIFWWCDERPHRTQAIEFLRLLLGLAYNSLMPEMHAVKATERNNGGGIGDKAKRSDRFHATHPFEK